VPVFYTTSLRRSGDLRASAAATRRGSSPGVVAVPADYEIHPDFRPHEADVVIEKGRPSAFFGTHLISYLVARQIDTVVVCGESTSGCVRATVVDAHSYGLHVLVVEDCVFDRVVTSHLVNLFDMQAKYADVLSLAQLEELLQWSPGSVERRLPPTDRSTPS
jgi:nicotinamidase-related amidase